VDCSADRPCRRRALADVVLPGGGARARRTRSRDSAGSRRGATVHSEDAHAERLESSGATSDEPPQPPSAGSRRLRRPPRPAAHPSLTLAVRGMPGLDPVLQTASRRQTTHRRKPSRRRPPTRRLHRRPRTPNATRSVRKPCCPRRAGSRRVRHEHPRGNGSKDSPCARVSVFRRRWAPPVTRTRSQSQTKQQPAGDGRALLPFVLQCERKLEVARDARISRIVRARLRPRRSRMVLRHAGSRASFPRLSHRASACASLAARRRQRRMRSVPGGDRPRRP
jgi:hypothetical protein